PYKKMHHSFEDDDEDDENDKDWVPDKGMGEDNVLVVLNIIKADYNRVVEEIDDKSMNMGGRRNLEVTGMGNSKHASPTTIKVQEVEGDAMEVEDDVVLESILSDYDRVVRLEDCIANDRDIVDTLRDQDVDLLERLEKIERVRCGRCSSWADGATSM